MYTLCANLVLSTYGRPPLPWSIKAQLMGRPGGSTSDIFMDWAQLPISREQYAKEQREEQMRCFPDCEALPGVESLLKILSEGEKRGKVARDVRGRKVHIALATSSEKRNYELKTSKPETRNLMECFPPTHRILGDDPRVAKGRGKPAPDIYLLALSLINSGLEDGAEQIQPGECLVFEDSVPGVEAGRRAGMQVVWVPHEGLLAEYKGKESEVLAGRMGMMAGEKEQLGMIDDGWGKLLPSLEDFPYEMYGIVVE